MSGTSDSRRGGEDAGAASSPRGGEDAGTGSSRQGEETGTTSSRRGGEGAVTEPIAYCLKIGFFAGIIWGFVRWLAVALNFTSVPAAFLADPWVRRSALASGYWQTVGYVLFIVMSIVAAFVYYALLKPLRGPLPGLMFGAAWWAVFYLAVGPAIGAVPPLRKIGWNSILTDLCLFTVWGLFIGYSIAFEYHEDVKRERKLAGA
ncbi:hypothetical protein GE107_12040 [Cohnella sp. CFH 77786]|uniref:YqhR family membrane protein n=1 Tax=Cohnella sp. CFH 77786 TaxID=2662265 RepID=UPI001C60CB96|nr:YqhR family membrane protein [Cohnella sp. CFH 77786]MBW5446793.1 hypothetical protein [Cohnella sp. CFH 77786]